MRDTIPALATDPNDGERKLTAPAVGRLTAAPAAGTILSPGEPFAELRILRRNYDLVVPDGVYGVVSEVLARAPVGVAYGDVLVTVSREGVAVEGGDANPGAAGDVAEDIPDGMVAVRAQTDGIFYRRPAPDEPAFVDEGAEFERGKVLGLVEVMKCFNQVKAPDAGRVAKVLVDDAGEVKNNQALFLIEPR
ncbi:MAG: biotin/lipoyl-containing protein [Planctomycetota bacterium]